MSDILVQHNQASSQGQADSNLPIQAIGLMEDILQPVNSFERKKIAAKFNDTTLETLTPDSGWASQTGASKVGFTPVSGITAQNVQDAIGQINAKITNVALSSGELKNVYLVSNFEEFKFALEDTNYLEKHIVFTVSIIEFNEADATSTLVSGVNNQVTMNFEFRVAEGCTVLDFTTLNSSYLGQNYSANSYSSSGLPLHKAVVFKAVRTIPTQKCSGLYIRGLPSTTDYTAPIPQECVNDLIIVVDGVNYQRNDNVGDDNGMQWSYFYFLLNARATFYGIYQYFTDKPGKPTVPMALLGHPTALKVLNGDNVAPPSSWRIRSAAIVNNTAVPITYLPLQIDERDYGRPYLKNQVTTPVTEYWTEATDTTNNVDMLVSISDAPETRIGDIDAVVPDFGKLTVIPDAVQTGVDVEITNCSITSFNGTYTPNGNDGYGHPKWIKTSTGGQPDLHLSMNSTGNSWYCIDETINPIYFQANYVCFESTLTPIGAYWQVNPVQIPNDATGTYVGGSGASSMAQRNLGLSYFESLKADLAGFLRLSIIPSAQPSGDIKGTVYFNQVSNKGFINNGTEWLQLGNVINEVLETDQIYLDIVAGILTAALKNDSVTYAKMQNVSASARLLGRNSSGPGDVEELTPAIVTAMLNTFTTSLKGLVPAPTAIAGYILSDNGSWVAQFSNADVDARINSTWKGTVGGFAPLDGTSKIPQSYLPAYVDDVLEYATFALFPTTGTTGVIYVVTSGADINKSYRWSGSVYVQLTDGSATGTAGGDLTGSYPNPTINTNAVTTAKIANAAVTLVKLASMAATSFLGRISALGTPEVISAVQATGMLSAFIGSGASAAKGLVPSPGTTPGTTRYLCENGSWATPPSGSSTPFNATTAGIVNAPGSVTGRYLSVNNTWVEQVDSVKQIKNAGSSGQAMIAPYNSMLEQPAMSVIDGSNGYRELIGIGNSAVIFNTSDGTLPTDEMFAVEVHNGGSDGFVNLAHIVTLNRRMHLTGPVGADTAAGYGLIYAGGSTSQNNQLLYCYWTRTCFMGTGTLTINANIYVRTLRLVANLTIAGTGSVVYEKLELNGFTITGNAVQSFWDNTCPGMVTIYKSSLNLPLACTNQWQTVSPPLTGLEPLNKLTHRIIVGIEETLSAELPGNNGVLCMYGTIVNSTTINIRVLGQNNLVTSASKQIYYAIVRL